MIWRICLTILAFFVIMIIVGAIRFVEAHDPFTGLHNASGGSCCSSEGPASDCKATIVRYNDEGQLQGYIDERWQGFGGGAEFTPRWVDIPDDKILPIEKNPVAGDVVCWLPHLGVMCYLPGRGT